MSQFNPYSEWLGVDPASVAPNHYELLGLDDFEDYTALIKSEADRRIARVKQFELDEHGELVPDIVEALTTARDCLIDPARRARYNQGLQRATDRTAELNRGGLPPRREPGSGPESTEVFTQPSLPAASRIPYPPAQIPLPPPRRSRAWLWITLSLLFWGAVGCGVFWSFFNPDRRAAVWALEQGASIMVEGHPDRFDRRDQLPSVYFRIERLRFRASASIHDEDLHYLAGLDRLEFLSLSQSPISDEGLAHLANIPSLAELSLSGTQVTDAGLAELTRLPNLEDLSLASTAVSDMGLIHIGRLPKLRKLYLQRTRVSDAGLQELARLKNLEVLNLDDTLVTDRGMEFLRALPLKQLLVRNTTVSDNGMVPVCEINTLDSIYVAGTHITEQGCAMLRRANSRVSIYLE